MKNLYLVVYLSLVLCSWLPVVLSACPFLYYYGYSKNQQSGQRFNLQSWVADFHCNICQTYSWDQCVQRFCAQARLFEEDRRKYGYYVLALIYGRRRVPTAYNLRYSGQSNKSLRKYKNYYKNKHTVVKLKYGY